MSFRAVLSDVSLLRDSVDTISQLIGEGIFEADEDGLSFTAADRAIVAVVDFRLDKSVFDVYEVSGPVEMGINVDRLLQILKRADSDDRVEMELSEDESRLNIKMVGSAVRNFSIPLLDISSGDLQETDTLDLLRNSVDDIDNMKSRLQVEMSVIERGINDAAIISDSLIFQTDDSTLTLKTEGDASSAELQVDKEGGLLSIEGGTSKSRYPLDYLKKMIKGGRISEVANISFGQDFPMRIEFIEPETAEMRFLLAPRVED